MVFPIVTPRFCCQAAVGRPRGTLLPAVTLYQPLSGSESELAIGGSFGVPVLRV